MTVHEKTGAYLAAAAVLHFRLVVRGLLSAGGAMSKSLVILIILL